MSAVHAVRGAMLLGALTLGAAAGATPAAAQAPGAREWPTSIVARGDTMIVIRPPTATVRLPPPVPGDPGMTAVAMADTLVMVLRGDSAVMVRPAPGAPVSRQVVTILKLQAQLERDRSPATLRRLLAEMERERARWRQPPKAQR